MIGLAKQSKSSGEFIEKIRETETLDITSALSTFANELYQKIPRGGTGNGSQKTMGQKRQLENRAREQAAKELAAKNQSYKLLSDDDDDIQVSTV